MNVRYRCPQMRMPARRRDAANAYCLSKERNDAGAAFGGNPIKFNMTGVWDSLGRIASAKQKAINVCSLSRLCGRGPLVACLRMTKRRSSLAGRVCAYMRRPLRRRAACCSNSLLHRLALHPKESQRYRTFI